MPRRIDPLRCSHDLLFHRAVALASALLVSQAMHLGHAQETAAPLVADYGDFELPPPISFSSTEHNDRFSAPRQESQTGGERRLGLPTPQRLPPTHCDDPGGFAPAPCPPVTHAPPKQQIHHVYVQPPCPPSAQPPQFAPPAQQPQTPPGAFVAPAQTGSVVQQQQSLGLRGMRITFPTLTLELPSIELPHWIRRGRAAHMELAAATAPYVAGAGVAQHSMPPMHMPATIAAGPMPRAQAPPQHQPPPQAAPPAAPHKPCLEKDFEELQLRCQRLEQLLEKMIQCQPQPTNVAPPPPQCLPEHYPLPLRPHSDR